MKTEGGKGGFPRYKKREKAEAKEVGSSRSKKLRGVSVKAGKRNRREFSCCRIGEEGEGRVM